MFNEIISCQKGGCETGKKSIERKGKIPGLCYNPSFQGPGRYGLFFFFFDGWINWQACQRSESCLGQSKSHDLTGKICGLKKSKAPEANIEWNPCMCVTAVVSDFVPFCVLCVTVINTTSDHFFWNMRTITLRVLVFAPNLEAVHSCLS